MLHARKDQPMTREQSLVDIENNPRLRAAQDHTWTWKTNTQGMGLDEDAPLPLPSFAELGPFAQVGERAGAARVARAQ